MTHRLFTSLTAGCLALAACKKDAPPTASPGAAPAARGAPSAHAHGAAPSKGTFEAELKTSPAQVVAGAPSELAFTVRDAKGRAVKALPLSHEKPMHLLVVSQDLATFAHLHPDPSADGAFRTSYRFPYAGDYLLFADYTPEGSPQVVDRFRVKAGGKARAPVELVESASPTQEAEGLQLTLRTEGPLRAGGAGSVLRFDVADAKTGKAVTDLEPYLGAMAHFVLIGEDTRSFLHAHPLEEAGANVTRVSAHTRFPAAGLYKVWVQLQRRGQVVTVPYVLRVEEGVQEAHAAHGH